MRRARLLAAAQKGAQVLEVSCGVLYIELQGGHAASGLLMRGGAGSHPFAELLEFIVVIHDVVDHQDSGDDPAGSGISLFSWPEPSIAVT